MDNKKSKRTEGKNVFTVLNSKRLKQKYLKQGCQSM